jgi:hypothetical protein
MIAGAVTYDCDNCSYTNFSNLTSSLQGATIGSFEWKRIYVQWRQLGLHQNTFSGVERL